MYKEGGDLLNILGMVGIALLTVMIPIAVSIFREKSDLDRHVILEYVIEARNLPCYLGLVYAPIILWAWISSPYFIFKVIFLVSWGAGVYRMLGILNKSYRWMKGETVELKSECLQKLKDSENLKDMESLWRSLWATEKITSWQERKFFIIFSATVDELLKGDVEKIRVGRELVNDFNLFIDKRSSGILVISEENFSKILEWHFFVWRKAYQLKSEKDINIEWLDYGRLSLTFSNILKKIEKRALKEKESFSFFRTFIPHVEECKKEFVENNQGDRYYYVRVVMSGFFDILVENIEYCRDIWGDFPDKWKITMENIEWEITTEKIEKPENCITNILWLDFEYWSRSRILNSTEYDKDLDDIAYNLFPHGCPIMWSRILTFMARRGWEGSDQMKSSIEHPSIFGNIGRTTGRGRMGDGKEAERWWIGDSKEAERKAMENMEKQRKAEEEETISLALHLFGVNFTQDNLQSYIDGLEELKNTYDSGTSMEYRRKDYIDIFEKLLKARCKKDAEK